MLMPLPLVFLGMVNVAIWREWQRGWWEAAAAPPRSLRFPPVVLNIDDFRKDIPKSGTCSSGAEGCAAAIHSTLKEFIYEE